MKGLHPNIIRLRTSFVNAYLISNGRRSVLIDAGVQRSGKELLSGIQNAGLDVKDISLMILTHPHYDHCKGARAIKQATGADLLVHRASEPSLRKGHCRLPKGTNLPIEIWTSMGRTFMPWLAYFPSVEPDLVMDQEYSLATYGLDARAIHTPGHTAGSVSIILDGIHAMVGDTMVGHLRSPYPPFADDPEELIRSWKVLVGLGIKYIYPGHGTPYPVDRLLPELERRISKTNL